MQEMVSEEPIVYGKVDFCHSERSEESFFSCYLYYPARFDRLRPQNDIAWFFRSNDDKSPVFTTLPGTWLKASGFEVFFYGFCQYPGVGFFEIAAIGVIEVVVVVFGVLGAAAGAD